MAIQMAQGAGFVALSLTLSLPTPRAFSLPTPRAFSLMLRHAFGPL